MSAPIRVCDPHQLDLVNAVQLSEIDFGKETLAFIADYTAREGHPPIFQEIADGVEGVRTFGHAAHVCGRLRLFGFLTWQERSPRTFKLTEEGMKHAA